MYNLFSICTAPGRHGKRKVVYISWHDILAGRKDKQSAELLPKLAREKARGMHPRLPKGSALAYQRRWAGLVSVGLMKAVAASALRGEGADLATTLLEPLPSFTDLSL